MPRMISFFTGRHQFLDLLCSALCCPQSGVRDAHRLYNALKKQLRAHEKQKLLQDPSRLSVRDRNSTQHAGQTPQLGHPPDHPRSQKGKWIAGRPHVRREGKNGPPTHNTTEKLIILCSSCLTRLTGIQLKEESFPFLNPEGPHASQKAPPICGPPYLCILPPIA